MLVSELFSRAAASPLNARALLDISVCWLQQLQVYSIVFTACMRAPLITVWLKRERMTESRSTENCSRKRAIDEIESSSGSVVLILRPPRRRRRRRENFLFPTRFYARGARGRDFERANCHLKNRGNFQFLCESCRLCA